MISVPRGIAIGLWGAVVYLPTLGIFAEAWLMWANCIVWAVVYSRVVPTLRLATLQALATLLAGVGGALLLEPSPYALLMVFPALLYFALWMAPVGIVASLGRSERPSA